MRLRRCWLPGAGCAGFRWRAIARAADAARVRRICRTRRHWLSSPEDLLLFHRRTCATVQASDLRNKSTARFERRAEDEIPPARVRRQRESPAIMIEFVRRASTPRTRAALAYDNDPISFHWRR